MFQSFFSLLFPHLSLHIDELIHHEALVSHPDALLGIEMLSMLVPILIKYLLEEDELQRATKYQASLHQQSFQWLNKIGPKYPQVGYFREYYSESGTRIYISIIMFRNSRR